MSRSRRLMVEIQQPGRSQEIQSELADLSQKPASQSDTQLHTNDQNSDSNSPIQNTHYASHPPLLPISRLHAPPCVPPRQPPHPPYHPAPPNPRLLNHLLPRGNPDASPPQPPSPPASAPHHLPSAQEPATDEGRVSQGHDHEAEEAEFRGEEDREGAA